jgi:hypothetical protein
MEEWSVVDGKSFEVEARRHLSGEFGVPLDSRIVKVAGVVDKSFDLVSADRAIVGDAKWYSRLAVPAAKWSTIAEYVRLSLGSLNGGDLGEFVGVPPCHLESSVALIFSALWHHRAGNQLS